MALPAPLLTSVERHACFTGSYHYESPVDVCADPAQPLSRMFHVSCGDCLSFKIGALSCNLPIGMTQYTLADALSAHVRALRGFRWSFSGYHAGPRFWLSAASFSDGLFLIDGSRNRNGVPEIDLLVEAFRHKLAQPADPSMLNASLYASEIVYVNLTQPLPQPVRTRQDLLGLPQCSRTPKQGYVRVALVEFQPFAAGIAAGPMGPMAGTIAQAPGATATAGVSPATAQAKTVIAAMPPPPPMVRAANPAHIAPPTPRSPAMPGKTLKIGDTCGTCGAEYKERPLFSGTFIGCLC